MWFIIIGSACDRFSKISTRTLSGATEIPVRRWIASAPTSGRLPLGDAALEVANAEAHVIDRGAGGPARVVLLAQQDEDSRIPNDGQLLSLDERAAGGGPELHLRVDVGCVDMHVTDRHAHRIWRG
jgi:hypothetical protein